MVDYMERDFMKLYEHIMYKRRYIYSNEFKDLLKKIVDFFKEREEIIPKNSALYRAQKGCDFDQDGIEIPFTIDRMYPLEKSSREGRANPKGISYLYLANKDYIAISEIRSWRGEYASLGTFSNNIELKVVDFSSDKVKSMILDTLNLRLLSDNSIESTFAEINEAFSKPITDSDNRAEYALTQMIAELVKNEGYDGLYYNSGYSKKDGEGKNLVIFENKEIKLRKVSVLKIKSISIEFEECNNPHFYSCDIS